MSRKILQIIVFARDFMHKLLGFVCAFIIYFFSWILPDLYKNFVAFFVVGEGCPFYILFGIMGRKSAKKYRILHTLWGNCPKTGTNDQKRQAARCKVAKSGAQAAHWNEKAIGLIEWPEGSFFFYGAYFIRTSRSSEWTKLRLKHG
ncbi:MAG TPA: hypothetical protein PKA81_06200 [Clostridia bacterium]|nr:hypothetical protein [Clostridia bacterium]